MASPRSSPAEPPPVFARYQSLIGDALRSHFEGRGPGLHDTLRYYLGWADAEGNQSQAPEGKAFRPTLCLLACEAAGGDPRRVLPAAVAIELVHNFSMIHDDIEDGDRTRRHRPTLWVVWGEPTAIVAGDCMLALADSALHGLQEQGVSTAIATRSAELLTSYYLSMMEGQYLDISYEGRTDVSVDDYLRMIEGKTGALIECSARLGALIGAGEEDEDGLVESLRAVGADLGRVYQIRDDVLGIWGGPALGKGVGSDILRKKKSLPVVHMFDNASPAERAELLNIYRQQEVEPADVERVLDVMDRLGTQGWCQERAAARWAQAKQKLDGLDLPGDALRQLHELGEFLLVRES